MESVSASRRPSGENEGAPLIPGSAETRKRLPVRSVCTQIEERLRRQGARMQYLGGLRITDDAALACVKEAAGAVRVEVEALLSMGLANSPMAGARIRAASGNYVTAKPIGVREGVDYGHTGEVRRVAEIAFQAAQLPPELATTLEGTAQANLDFLAYIGWKLRQAKQAPIHTG